MSYPPVIRIHDFEEPPEVAVVNACTRGGNTCGVEVFELNEHTRNKVSFADQHIALLAEDDGRFPFAPGVDTFTVHWRFSGHAYIAEAKLELFIRDRALAIWSKTMRWGADARRAESTTQFNGSLRTNYAPSTSSTDAVVVAVAHGIDVVFPAAFLTAEHAPYKFKLSITEVEPHTRLTTKERWIYLDVIATIDLSLGPRAWFQLPAVPPYETTRRMANNYLAFADVDNQVNDAPLTADNAPAEVKLRIPHNVFSKSGIDFYNNTHYRGSFELWREDPLVPLLAKLRVLRANGAAATAAQSAPLLGNLSVYWDWTSGARPAHPNEKARTFVNAAVAYKTSEWRQAAANCHKDHGGKRGIANVHFGAVAALAGPANAVTASARRPWSAFTRPITDAGSDDAATAGVFLRPSRIGGDRYRPSVQLAYPTAASFDTADADAFALAAGNAPRAESRSTITVWRSVTVANYFRKTGNILADLDWGRMNAHYAPAYIELTPPAAVTTISQTNYVNAMRAIFPTFPEAIGQSIARLADQYNGDYVINFKSYDDFKAGVLTHVRNAKLTLSLLDPQTTADVIAGQMRGIAPRNQPIGDDLFIPDLGTYRLSNDRIVTKVLDTIGITDEDSYEKKLIPWSHVIMERLCDDLMRRLARDSQGVSIFQFNFADNYYHDSPAGLAVTSHATPQRCPNCDQALAAAAYPPKYWDDDKNLGNRICTGCQLRIDDNAAVLVVAPFRCMRGQADDAVDRYLTDEQKLKITAARLYRAQPDLCVAHEIGHQLGLPHAGGSGLGYFVPTGAIHPRYHDADDGECLMSYNLFSSATMHFCGFCTLRLCGWSAGPSDRWNPRHFDRVSDANTVPLYNKAANNAARIPAANAVWAADAANCSSCNTAVGWGSRHHCRLCGAFVCGNCSNHTMLVTRPLSNAGASQVRVCTDCAGLANPKTPDIGAYWQDDAASDFCPACRRRFNDDRKRHHCRLCGALRCDACAPLPKVAVFRPVEDKAPESVRVCDTCYATR